MQRLNKELTVLAVIIVVTALAIAQAHRQYGKTINEKGKAKSKQQRIASASPLLGNPQVKV